MGKREEVIRQIIALENRISQCQRCTSLIRCTRKPTLGKGDLEPEVFLVFESDTDFTQEAKRLIEFRDLVKKSFQTKSVYHSYMVRCHPKACSNRSIVDTYDQGTISKLINNDNNCRLNNQPCKGMLIKPGNEEIVFCLPFLIEEIEILQPKHVIMCGDRVKQFILKSYGIFDKSQDRYEQANMVFITSDKEDICTSEHILQLSKYM